MGLIRTATLLGAGYVLGARAGTARYDQIAAAARRAAARPEVRPYLGPLADRLQPPPVPAATPAAPASPPATYGAETGLAGSGSAADVLAEPVLQDLPPATGGVGTSRLRRRATAGPRTAGPGIAGPSPTT